MELRTFVLLALISISQQQYQRQWYHHPRFIGNLPATYQQQLYLGLSPEFAPSVVAKGESDGRRWMSHNPYTYQTDDSMVIVAAPPKVAYDFNDGDMYDNLVQLREPVRIAPDHLFSPSPKLFFGGGGLAVANNQGAASNPLIRTVAVIVTSTMNVTTTSLCAAKGDFSFTTPCRRRRRDSLMLATDDGEQIVSSELLKVESTPLHPYEERNARLAQILESSKEDFLIEERNEQNPPSVDASLNREKRLFFPRATTTTLTSYVFATVATARTISLVSAPNLSSLQCLPPNIVLC